MCRLCAFIFVCLLLFCFLPKKIPWCFFFVWFLHVCACVCAFVCLCVSVRVCACEIIHSFSALCPLKTVIMSNSNYAPKFCMHMHIYIDMCVYHRDIYMYIYICMYIYTHICTYIYKNTHIHIYIYTFFFVCICWIFFPVSFSKLSPYQINNKNPLSGKKKTLWYVCILYSKTNKEMSL